MREDVGTDKGIVIPFALGGLDGGDERNASLPSGTWLSSLVESVVSTAGTDPSVSTLVSCAFDVERNNENKRMYTDTSVCVRIRLARLWWMGKFRVLARMDLVHR